MKRLTDEEIAELERLQQEATPGAWHTVGPGGGWGNHVAIKGEGGVDGPCVVHQWNLDQWVVDARAIVAGRNALPYLLAEVRASRASPSAPREVGDVLDAARGLMRYSEEGGPDWNDWEPRFEALRAALRLLSGADGKEGT